MAFYQALYARQTKMSLRWSDIGPNSETIVLVVFGRNSNAKTILARFDFFFLEFFCLILSSDGPVTATKKWIGFLDDGNETNS